MHATIPRSTTCEQALANEISSVADAARQRAEGSQNPKGSRGNTPATFDGGITGLRPLMPRSLRGAPGARASAAPGANRGMGVRRVVKAETTTTTGVVERGSSGEEVTTSGVREEGDERDGSAVGAAGVAKRKKSRKRKKDEGAQQTSNVLRTAPEGENTELGSGSTPRGEPGEESLLEKKSQRTAASSKKLVVGSGAVPDEGGDEDALSGGAGRGTADSEQTGTEATSFLAGCAVSFWREDFVVDSHGGGGDDHGGYDVVCLFSIVKWMHLNGGDEAVRRVFRKVYRLLRPGGRLILEPQVGGHPTTDAESATLLFF